MGADLLTLIALVVMTAACAAGIAWVFIAPHLTGEARAEKRFKTVRDTAPSRPIRGAQVQGREGGGAKRKQLEETLKDLEKQKKQMNRPPLSKRLQRSGLSWGVRTFILFSVGCGFIFLVIGLLANAPIWALPVLVFAGGFGFPRWFLGFVTTRRQNKFLNEFPNAVDVIVRGIKAGLPLNDCLRMIATEAAEPVKTEFRQTIEAQAMGLSTSECVQRIYERMPLPEVNFFTIVIAIQQRSGGNLAEALGNLSKVLRDRKKMKGKIVALSQEAKASAAIIGALPIVVMILIFITSPDYISLLWTEELGHIMLAGCAFWMFCGVLVMRKMINFKF